MTRTVMTLTIAAAAWLPHVASAQNVGNNLHCFAIKDTAPRARYQATVTTAAGTQTCTIRTPAKVACVGAAVSGVTPAPPGGGPAGSGTAPVLCYLAKCRPVSLSTNTEDAFGRRVIRFRTSRFVCAPADLNAPPPGETTTTTTLVGGGTECRFTDGECRGTCAGGGRCGAAVGTGSCECRSISCGDADAPECDGACASPGEACIFDLSGCSCVNIPGD